MRYALAAAVILAAAPAAAPAAARTEFPEMMSAYDLAWDQCRARTETYPDQNAGCRKLKSLSASLQKGGYYLVPESANPRGFRWN